MRSEDRDLLRTLLVETRVLSLAVLVDGRPHVGLLPYALREDFGACLVHASGLARHSRGLADGAPFSLLIHAPDGEGAEALQLPRVTLEGDVVVLPRGSDEWVTGRDLYLARFPASAVTFSLGDFRLYELRLRGGRLVGGFARAATVTEDILASLAG